MKIERRTFLKNVGTLGVALGLFPIIRVLQDGQVKPVLGIAQDNLSDEFITQHIVTFCALHTSSVNLLEARKQLSELRVRGYSLSTEMPCGFTFDATEVFEDGFILEDIPCPCGNPNHFFLRTGEFDEEEIIP